MEPTPATEEPRQPPYRPLVVAAVLFAIGIGLREMVPTPRIVGWAVAAAACAAFPLAHWLDARRVRAAAVLLLLVAAGWVRLDVAAAPPPRDHIALHLGPTGILVRIRGVAEREPETYRMPGLPLSGESEWLSEPTERARFPLRIRQVCSGGEWRAARGRLRVTVFEPKGGVRCGDELVLTGFLRRPEPPTNPGQFNSAKLLRRRGIDATLGTEGPHVQVTRPATGAWPFQIAQAARAAVRRFLWRSLATSDRARSLLCATLLGDRAELDEEFEEAFKRSGTAHLLAISGLHVGIVAWLVWQGAALAGLGRRAAGMVVLGAVGAYAMMTGMTPSVMRAGIMTVALVGSIVGRRRLDPLQAVGLAALVLLMLRPFDLFHAGFQLSFAAVISILGVCGYFHVALRPDPSLEERLLVLDEARWGLRARLWLRGWAVPAASVSLAAWLGVLPLIAYYFNVFSPVTVLANLLAVPLLTAVVALGFAHVALGALWSVLGIVPGLLARSASGLLALVVESAARVPLGWTYCATPALGWVAAYYALGLLVVWRWRRGLSGHRAGIVWLLGMLVYLVATLRSPRPEGLEVTALDVQHGNATVLRYPDGSTVVCDAGCYGRTDVGATVVAPAFWRWGVRRIDLIVVSHADVDHINGIPALLDRFAVGHVVYSPIVERSEAGRQLLAMLDARGIPHESARAGDRIAVGDGHVLEALAPADWTLRAWGENQNENSLVVRAEHDGRRVLVAGDIQVVASTVLLGRGADVRADVLIVPHHGCAMPNADAFAKAVRPRVALVSNLDDRIVPAVVDAYRAVGARVLATCSDGAITARIQDGQITVETSGDRRAAERRD